MAEHPTPDELRELVCFVVSEAASAPDDGGRRSAMLRGMIELMRDYQRTGMGETGRYDRDTPEREVHVRWAAVFGALVTHADRHRARKAAGTEVAGDMLARFGLDVRFAFDPEAPDFDPHMLSGRGAKMAARRITAELMRRSRVSGAKAVPALWRRFVVAADRDARGEVLTEADLLFMGEVERHLRGETPADPGEPFALLRSLTRLFPDLPPVHLFAHIVRSNPGPLPADAEGLMRLLAPVTEPAGPGSRRFVQRSG